MRLAEALDPPLFLLQHTVVSVFRVAIWLLWLQLACLHSSQEEGKSRRGEGCAPVLCSPQGAFLENHSGASLTPSWPACPFLQPVFWGLTKSPLPQLNSTLDFCTSFPSHQRKPGSFPNEGSFPITLRMGNLRPSAHPEALPGGRAGWPEPLQAHPVGLSGDAMWRDDGGTQDHPSQPGCPAPEPSGNTAIVLPSAVTLSSPPHTLLCPDADQMGR